MPNTFKVPSGLHSLSDVHLSIDDLHNLSKDTVTLIDLAQYMIAKNNNRESMPTVGSLEYGDGKYTKDFITKSSVDKLIGIIVQSEGLNSQITNTIPDIIKTQHVKVITEKLNHMIPQVMESLNLADVRFEWNNKTSRVMCYGTDFDGKSVVINILHNCIVPDNKIASVNCKFGNRCTDPVCANQHIGRILQVCSNGLKCKNVCKSVQHRDDFNESKISNPCIRMHFMLPYHKVNINEKSETRCRFDNLCKREQCPFMHSKPDKVKI